MSSSDREADVIGAAIGELRRNGVRGQQRGNDARWAFFVQALDHAEHAQLGFAVEAVAGFGFQRCCPAAQHPVAVAAGGGEELVFRGGAGEPHGSQDAAAGRGNLLVSDAGDALLKFLGAVAGKDQMRVGVNESGCDAAALRVDDGCAGWNTRADRHFRSSCGDAAVLDEQRSILDDGEIAKLCAWARARWAGEGDKLADVDDGDGHVRVQEASGRCDSIPGIQWV